MKRAQCSRASLYQKEEAENTLIIQPISLLDRLYLFRPALLECWAKGLESFYCSFVGGYSTMDFETNIVIAFVYDLV